MATPLYNDKPMTLTDIDVVLDEYQQRREQLLLELDTLDKMVVYWKKQRDTLKPNLFEQMFGETVDFPEIRMKTTDFLP